jgi:CIC family chloride channel protein
MLRDVETVREDAPLNSIVNVMIQKQRFYLPVLDKDDLMMGIVSIQDVRPVMFDEYIKGIVRAGELATENVITLKPGDNLNAATELFAMKDVEEIPVVSPDNPRQVVGVLRRRDVMEAYNREVLKQDRSEAF